ncbi:MAG: hypothetical protein K0Q72_1758 [Armatimonadetes bacterium]|jgi:hypothetical protein|nr:hypothetical protein [Armatimonadota bacterium]
MSMIEPVTVMSAHLRYGSRESLVDALVRLDVGRGVPIPVWPPRRLPYGLFISPERNGWISLWTPLGNMREWLPQLTATLECPGILFEIVEGQFWITELFQDERFHGRLELPSEAIRYDDLWARTVDSLEAEGVDDPTVDEARFGARLDEIAASEEYQGDLRALDEEWPEQEALRAYLPPHASLEMAWELLTEVDRAEPNEDEEAEPEEVEEYLDRFAAYLGIRDAVWDPTADAEALEEGEYEEEEGLPEGWRDFLVLPIPQLRVL